MMAPICGVGAAAVLVCALIRGLESTVRGLVCWTFSSLAAVLALAVYFSSYSFAPDVPAILFAVGGTGVMAVIIMLIELFAPSKRFQKHRTDEYDVSRSESALNLVMVIMTSVFGAAVIAGEYMGGAALSGICLVPAAAMSLRQLSYYLHLARLESVMADTDEKKRARLMKTLDDNTSRKL